METNRFSDYSVPRLSIAMKHLQVALSTVGEDPDASQMILLVAKEVAIATTEKIKKTRQANPFFIIPLNHERTTAIVL